MKFYFSLKQREYPKKVNKIFIAAILFMFAFTYYFSQPIGCQLYAASISDYCYRYSLNVTNETDPLSVNYRGNLSNYPILLPNTDIASWISTDYIDDFGWSIFPYQASLVDEYQVLLQDINSTQANQWYVMPNLFTGDNQLSVLLGANNIQRNQGIFFAGEDVGGDYLKVDNHNDFNSSNFSYEIQIEDTVTTSFTSPVTTHTIIEKYDESDPNPALHTGFKIEYLDYGNLGVVKATVNNAILQSAVFEPCSLPNTSSTCNTKSDYIKFEYATGFMNLTVNGVYVFTAASFTSNTEDLYIGANYETTFSNYLDNSIIRVIDYDSNNSLAAYYGFNPLDITQTSAVDPLYSGTVNDISGSPNIHNAAYFFDRSQVGLSASASNITPSSSSGSTIFNQQTRDIAGNWFGNSTPNQLSEQNNNMIGLSFLAPPSNLGLPNDLWYSMWLSAFGMVFALGLFWLFSSIPVSMFGASLPWVLGSISGLIMTEFIVIYFILILSLYSVQNWYERS